MSVITSIVLKCDVCGVLFGEEDTTRPAKMLRYLSKLAGWTFSGETKTDRCPNCRYKWQKNLNKEINETTI